MGDDRISVEHPQPANSFVVRDQIGDRVIPVVHPHFDQTAVKLILVVLHELEGLLPRHLQGLAGFQRILNQLRRSIRIQVTLRIRDQPLILICRVDGERERPVFIDRRHILEDVFSVFLLQLFTDDVSTHLFVLKRRVLHPVSQASNTTGPLLIQICF